MRTKGRSSVGVAGMCMGILALWSALLAAPAGAATFTSGSTGADGPFNPTCTPTPCTVTVPLPPAGVFHFTTITIGAGITVRFAKNPTNTPVTLLASGDVTLAGTLTLDGQPGSPGANATSFGIAGGAGGPGGFDGGTGGNAVAAATGGVGLGPGGGGTGPATRDCAGAGGGFGSPGLSSVTTVFCASPGGTYGNSQLLPLLGGSGGGGGSATLGTTAGAGGGGGGAILIAASGTLTFTGTIAARGGEGGASSLAFNGNKGGGGAGGAVRLVATMLTGSGGSILVMGGAGVNDFSNGTGGVGRLRLEAPTNSLNVNVAGVTPSIGTPGVVFPRSLPTLAITSVGGVAAPPAPSGAFATPDVTLPSTTTSPVPVVVTATNIPDGTPVLLRGKPQAGTATTATTPGLSGSTASASLALDLTQPSVLSAEATFTLAAVEVPVHVVQAAGEEDPVTHMRVAAAYGGGSRVTYITRAGRELTP